ncbi:phage tail assembly chaperone [Enterobacter sp. BB-069-C-ECC]|uniref:phage tail assembly chaperone n=1 Tax=unclassified Enterobacter TaxID=2608935 RepID=UPI003862217E
MECSIKGHDYRVAKLSVFDQLKVTRKLLPVLAGMMSEFGSIRSLLPADLLSAGGKIDTVKFDKLQPVFETLLPCIAEKLSSLTEEDTNAIIHPCLAVVSRKHMDGWTPVFNSGQLMFDDIDLLTMLQLVARVVADSLGNFLPVSPISATADQPQG